MSILDISDRYLDPQIEKLADGDQWTATAATGQAITGGRLVEHTTGDRVVQTAGDESIKVAGVAQWSVASGATERKVTVFSEGIVMLRASGAINPGDWVCAGAAGVVKAMDGTEDYRAVVGQAVAGISNGADGPVRLKLN